MNSRSYERASDRNRDGAYAKRANDKSGKVLDEGEKAHLFPMENTSSLPADAGRAVTSGGGGGGRVAPEAGAGVASCSGIPATRISGIT
jgi:hypothetical protein